MVVDCSQSSLPFHRGTNTHGLITKKKECYEIWACLYVHGISWISWAHDYLLFTPKSYFVYYFTAFFYFSVNFDRQKKKKKPCLCNWGHLHLETYIQEMFTSWTISFYAPSSFRVSLWLREGKFFLFTLGRLDWNLQSGPPSLLSQKQCKGECRDPQFNFILGSGIFLLWFRSLFCPCYCLERNWLSATRLIYFHLFYQR